MSHAARPFAERFWEKVNRRGKDECWLWTAATTNGGYGVIGVGHARLLRAHCVSYELHHGPIPAGLVVRHKCDVPACVNPTHLELGTKLDNSRDMVERGRVRSKVKYPQETVDAIRAEPGTLMQVAEKFGVSFNYVGMLRRGLRRKT